MAVNFFDYCETAYCSEVDYSGGRAEDAMPAQVLMVVTNKQEAVNTQVLQKIEEIDGFFGQVLQQIEDEELPIGTQVDQQIISPDDDFKLRAQVNMALAGETSTIMSQVQMVIANQGDIPAQVLQHIVDSASRARAQVMQHVEDKSGSNHFSVLNDKVHHNILPIYCAEPFDYCTDNYCAERMQATPRVQVVMQNKTQTELGAQVEQHIVSPDDDYIAKVQVAQHIKDKQHNINSQVHMILNKLEHANAQVEMVIKEALDVCSQVQMVIKKSVPVGTQTIMVRGDHTPTQVTNVIYNTRRIRFLDRFPSRGTQALGGNNWTDTPVQSNPDYSPNNVNTDVPEQVYRSPAGTSAFVQLTCDTGLIQGVFLDTFAMLNHNLTKGATVSIQGSADNFATVGVNIPLTVNLKDMYYIAPALPISGWRYWRLNIVDAFNPDGFIEIGIILFGAAKIFTMVENFVNPLVSGFRDFKDVIQTEGFRNVSNDRALRKFLKLQFQDLSYKRSNYKLLEDVFKEARTSSAVLWIPTPQTPERYSVFGKLVSLPEITVSNNDEDSTDYLTLNIEIDEST